MDNKFDKDRDPESPEKIPSIGRDSPDLPSPETDLGGHEEARSSGAGIVVPVPAVTQETFELESALHGDSARIVVLERKLQRLQDRKMIHEDQIRGLMSRRDGLEGELENQRAQLEEQGVELEDLRAFKRQYSESPDEELTRARASRLRAEGETRIETEQAVRKELAAQGQFSRERQEQDAERQQKNDWWDRLERVWIMSIDTVLVGLLGYAVVHDPSNVPSFAVATGAINGLMATAHYLRKKSAK